MGRNNGNHGPKTWRAWCYRCKRYLAMNSRPTHWPDELRCPLCQRWYKVMAVGTAPLHGDVICPAGSGRNRVEEK